MDAISALIGVLVGGVFARWWDQRLRDKKERRAALGVALADLLEVRHQLLAGDLFVRMVKEKAPSVPQELLPQVRTFFERLIPQNEDLNARYARAITTLSTVDPLAAFELRSKNLLPQMFNALRTLGTEHSVNPVELEQYESEVRQAIKPKMDKAVTDLASKYSWWTGREVKALVKEGMTVPPELQAMLAKFLPKPDSNDKTS